MKKVPLRSVAALAAHVGDLERQPVVLTANGRAVAAVVALPNTDAETVSLATNPDFLALIARSRRQAVRRGGVSSDVLRERLGLGPVRQRKKRAAR